VADLQCDDDVQHSGLVQGHRKHSNTGTVRLFTLLNRVCLLSALVDDSDESVMHMERCACPQGK
jgi:hypothetical protein